MIDDKELYTVARSYIGTPHINRGNVKGAGLDCCTLPAHIFHELLGVEAKINFNYSCDWYCKRNCEEILLPYLQEYCYEVKDLQVGDILSYRWGRAKYAHLAVFLGRGRVIHCSADAGTEITEINSPCFVDGRGESRQTGIWRLKHGLPD